MQLDESTLSEAERKKLQGVRASYKLDGVLDFDGAGSNEVRSFYALVSNFSTYMHAPYPLSSPP